MPLLSDTCIYLQCLYLAVRCMHLSSMFISWYCNSMTYSDLQGLSCVILIVRGRIKSFKVTCTKRWSVFLLTWFLEILGNNIKDVQNLQPWLFVFMFSRGNLVWYAIYAGKSWQEGFARGILPGDLYQGIFVWGDHARDYHTLEPVEECSIVTARLFLPRFGVVVFFFAKTTISYLMAVRVHIEHVTHIGLSIEVRRHMWEPMFHVRLLRRRNDWVGTKSRRTIMSATAKFTIYTWIDLKLHLSHLNRWTITKFLTFSPISLAWKLDGGVRLPSKFPNCKSENFRQKELSLNEEYAIDLN